MFTPVSWYSSNNMLQSTTGIVLRTVKYGETSLICTIFTERYGICSYMVQGIRSSKKHGRAGLLQVASLLDMVAEHKPGRQLQRIREFQPSYIYTAVQEDIVRNSVAVFSVELLQKLLPQEEPLPDLFEFCYGYFCALDKEPVAAIANYPLYFIIHCGRQLGYNILGHYSAETPYLNSVEGMFAAHPSLSGMVLDYADAAALAQLIDVKQTLSSVFSVELNAGMRNRLLDWYIRFLQHHTQHLPSLRSLEILRAILH